MSSLIGSLLIVGSAALAPSTYIPVAEAKAPEPTLQEVAQEIAREYEISTSTLFNLVHSESRWDPNASSTTGDYGLVQINPKYHNVTIEQALDPVFALKFAAKRIKSGQEYQWTACNCFSLVKTKIKNLPRMADIYPNSVPDVGKVAIFYYGSVKHVAYITKITGTGFWVLEANYEPCLIEKRFVSYADRALVGYWSASP